MHFGKFFPLVALCLVTQATATLAKADTKTKCNVDIIPTTCANGFYCQAGKTFSYCNEKKDGGELCDKDDACRSGICFIKKGKGKRTCAAVPTKNFPLHARCTLSNQCLSEFCNAGFCEKPLPAGEKCPKEAGCAQRKLGAHCLDKPQQYIVYDSKGKKSTEKLTAGHCSYIRNLGEGMKCASDINCYEKRFFCHHETKECTAIPSNLPYNATCTADKNCASKHCHTQQLGGALCGCTPGDCDAKYWCDSTANCQAQKLYGNGCASNVQCRDNVCKEVDIGDFRCGCSNDNPCDDDQWCNAAYNQCVSQVGYGAACSRDRTCSSGLCIIGSCACVSSSDCNAGDGEYCDVVSHSCKTKLSYGATCVTDEVCQSNVCSDSACGCSEATELIDCDDSQYCDTGDSVCVAKHGVEGSCSRPNMCFSGFCDDTLCRCDSDSDCSDPDTQWCSSINSNLCVAKGAYGDNCGANNECLDPVCTASGLGRRNLSISNDLLRRNATMHCGCSTTASCSSGQRCDVGLNLCIDLLGYHESCTTSSECASDNCFSSDGDFCACKDDAECQSLGYDYCDGSIGQCQII